MENENKNTPLTSPEINQTTQESTLPAAGGSQQDSPKKGSKILKVAVYVLSSVILLALGASMFWFYQEKVASKLTIAPPLPAVTSPTPLTTTVPNLNPSPSVLPSPRHEEIIINETYQEWNSLFVDGCGFNILYPPNWLIQNEVGSWMQKPGLLDGCVLIHPPETKIDMMPAYNDGFFIHITKTTKGIISETVNSSITINTLDDYINFSKQSSEIGYSKSDVKNIRDITIGNKTGKAYTVVSRVVDNPTFYFIFADDNNIYRVIWNEKYVEKYQNQAYAIINSITF